MAPKRTRAKKVQAEDRMDSRQDKEASSLQSKEGSPKRKVPRKKKAKLELTLAELTKPRVLTRAMTRKLAEVISADPETVAHPNPVPQPKPVAKPKPKVIAVPNRAVSDGNKGGTTPTTAAVTNPVNISDASKAVESVSPSKSKGRVEKTKNLPKAGKQFNSVIKSTDADQVVNIVKMNAVNNGTMNSAASSATLSFENVAKPIDALSKTSSLVSPQLMNMNAINPTGKGNVAIVSKSKDAENGTEKLIAPAFKQLEPSVLNPKLIDKQMEKKYAEASVVKTSTLDSKSKSVESSTLNTTIELEADEEDKTDPSVPLIKVAPLNRPKHLFPSHPQSPSLLRNASCLDTLYEDESQVPQENSKNKKVDLDVTYVIHSSHEGDTNQSVVMLNDSIASPDPDSYNITLFTEYDEDMEHRKGKQISKWASNVDYLREQLYITQPCFMNMLVGRRGENPIFPPVNVMVKLFPGAVDPGTKH